MYWLRSVSSCDDKSMPWFRLEGRVVHVRYGVDVGSVYNFKCVERVCGQIIDVGRGLSV